MTADDRSIRPMTNPKTSLDCTIQDALPLLMRDRIIESVLAAQRIAGEPVTAQEARATRPEPIMRSARSFSDAAKAVARMGPDAQGRVLRCAGPNRKRLVRWWVEETTHAPGE